MYVDRAGNIFLDSQRAYGDAKHTSLTGYDRSKSPLTGISPDVPPAIRALTWVTDRLKCTAGSIKAVGLRPKSRRTAQKSREVQQALAVLEEAERKFVHQGLFDSDAFDLVTGPIEKALLERPLALEQLLKEARGTPREWVYAQISNIAGDHLESGRFHLYRGLLNSLGPGHALLRISYGSLDELVALGHIDA